MAYPSSQLDAAKNPQTRCSNCQTVFEVSRELLSSSDTRVRCGECLSIFDALEELRSSQEIAQDAGVDGPASVGTTNQTAQDASAASENKHRTAGAPNLNNSGAAAVAGLHNETSSLDVTYSDFDLFSEEADLPEIAYFDQTRDTPDFDFDSVEMANDETFSDTLFVHDVTIDADATTARRKPAQNTAPQSTYTEVDFVADEQPREPLIFNYRDAKESPEQGSTEGPTLAQEPPSASPATSQPSAAVTAATDTGSATPGVAVRDVNMPDLSTSERRTSPWIFRLGMLALLGVLLGALFAYRTRPQLYNNPTMRPVLEAGCKIAGCSLPARVDVSALKMVKRNVYSHPNTPNALVINVSFRNDAEFAQQLPLLHMVLSNRVGRTVAKQDFSPEDYLPQWQPGATIDAGQQLDITLEVTDPGQDAQSFEFYFREFKS